MENARQENVRMTLLIHAKTVSFMKKKTMISLHKECIEKMYNKEDVKILCDKLALIAWNAEPQNAQTIVEAIELMKSQPQIVRCKDCKHLGYTSSHWFCKWLNRCVDEDWFCADGEAKDEDDER